MHKIRIIFLIYFIVSCSKSPTKPHPSENPIEDRGTLIFSDALATFSTLIWSKKTDEIITASNYGLRALNVSTHRMRPIVTKASIYHIQLSNDGNKIYYILGGSRKGGEVKPLGSISLDGSDQKLLLNKVYVTQFALSSENMIAYNSSADSLCLYDNESKSSTFLSFGNPITFSGWKATVVW